jgi:hypothetical protein
LFKLIGIRQLITRQTGFLLIHVQVEKDYFFLGQGQIFPAHQAPKKTTLGAAEGHSQGVIRCQLE